MKKIYIQPALTSVTVNSERPLAGSNEVFGQGIDFNRQDMDSNDGSDAAVKSANYSVWEYNWDE